MLLMEAYNRKKDDFKAYLNDPLWNARVLSFPKGHCWSVATGFMEPRAESIKKENSSVLNLDLDDTAAAAAARFRGEVRGIFVKDRCEDEAYVQQTVSLLATEFMKPFSAKDLTVISTSEDADLGDAATNSSSNTNLDSDKPQDVENAPLSMVAPLSFAIPRPKLEELRPDGPGHCLWKLKEEIWQAECQQIKELRDRLAATASSKERDALIEEAPIENEKKRAPSKYPCWQLEEALTYCDRPFSELDEILQLAATTPDRHVDASLRRKLRLAAARSSTGCLDLSKLLYLTEIQQLYLRKKIATTKMKSYILDDMQDSLSLDETELLFREKICGDDFALTILFAAVVGIPDINVENLSLQEVIDDDQQGTWHVRLVHLDTGIVSVSAGEGWESLECVLEGDDSDSDSDNEDDDDSSSSSSSSSSGSIEDDFTGSEECRNYYYPCLYSFPAMSSTLSQTLRDRFLRVDGAALEQLVAEALCDETIHEIGLARMGTIVHNRLKRVQAFVQDHPAASLKEIGFHAIAAWRRDYPAYQKRSNTALWFQEIIAWDKDDSSSSSSSSSSAQPKLPYDKHAWKELPRNVQDAAKVLGFTRKIWDKDLKAPSEDKGWNELSKKEKKAAMTLGYNGGLWNDEGSSDGSSRYVAEGRLPYNDKDWNELPPDVREAAKLLGYTRRIWDRNLAAPCESKAWCELSVKERTAASKLGYTKTSWDLDDENQGEKHNDQTFLRGVPNVKEISFTSNTSQEVSGLVAKKISQVILNEDDVSEESLIESVSDSSDSDGNGGGDHAPIPVDIVGIERIHRRFARRDRLLSKALKGHNFATRHFMLEQEQAARQHTLEAYCRRVSEKATKQLVEAQMTDFETPDASSKSLSLIDVPHSPAWSRFIFLDVPNISRAVLSALCYCAGHMGLNWMINYAVDLTLAKSKLPPSVVYSLLACMGLLLMFANGYLWIWLNPSNLRLKKLDMHNRALLQSWDARLLRWFESQSFNNQLDMIAYHAFYIAVYYFLWQGMESFEKFVWGWEQWYEKHLLNNLESPAGSAGRCDPFLLIQNPTNVEQIIHYFCRHHDDLEGDIPQLAYFLMLTTVAATVMAKLGKTIFER